MSALLWTMSPAPSALPLQELPATARLNVCLLKPKTGGSGTKDNC
jgi:hypothetical protein